MGLAASCPWRQRAPVPFLPSSLLPSRPPTSLSGVAVALQAPAPLPSGLPSPCACPVLTHWRPASSRRRAIPSHCSHLLRISHDPLLSSSPCSLSPPSILILVLILDSCAERIATTAFRQSLSRSVPLSISSSCRLCLLLLRSRIASSFQL